MKVYTKHNYEHKIDGATFFFKPLSVKKYMMVQDTLKIQTSGNGEMSFSNWNEYMYNMVKYTLVGWEGIVDEKNKQIPFPKDIEDALEILPAHLITTLGTFVKEQSEISKEEEKN